jgi:arabinofuranosyltransferase
LLSLWTSVALLNRVDLAVLLVPPLVFTAGRAFRARGSHAGRSLAIGLAPLALWFVFASAYFGSPLPNTALAKLAPGVPRSFYLREGFYYLVDFAFRDPAGIMFAAAGILCAVLLVSDGVRKRQPGDEIGSLVALGAGASLYVGYVVWIGGGFLTGRLFVPSLWACIVVLACGADVAWRARTRMAVAVASLGLVALLVPGAAGVRWAYREPPHGPIHELSLAHQALGLDGKWRMTPMARAFREGGEAMRMQAQSSGERVVGITGAIGFAGFAAGPNVVIIDPHALADAWLARRPPDDEKEWRIGHLPRRVPDGYLRARRTGDTSELAPALRAEYERVRLVVSGPLWNGRRARAIVELGLGLAPANTGEH